jgi:hypothetical protein
MVFVVFPYQNEMHKATSHGASPVKTQPKTVFIGEKLCVINQLEKGENISNIYYAVGLIKSTIFTIFNNAEKIRVLSQDICCVL